MQNRGDKIKFLGKDTYVSLRDWIRDEELQMALDYEEKYENNRDDLEQAKE